MSKYFYTSELNAKDSIVLYSSDQYGEFLADSILQKGYIEAANIIIENLMEQVVMGPQHDCLIYPLLNIYCCILEFSLKIAIRELLKHQATFNCPFINCPKININKTLLGHDLDKLVKIFTYVTNSNISHPHLFSNLTLISTIINEFREYGVDVYSSRYHQSKNKAPYPLYDKQKNIRVIKLHKDIEEIGSSTYYYLTNISFELCELGYYNKIKFQELEKWYVICKRYERLFLPLSSQKDMGNGSKSPFITEDDLLRKEYAILIDEVSNLTIYEQNVLLSCLYLATRSIGGFNINGLDDKGRLSEIKSLAHNFNAGIVALKNYIDRIAPFTN